MNFFEFPSKISLIFSAVRTGRVDFSITILSDLEYLAMSFAQASIYLKSAAIPAPFPSVFVGVLTAINIISAFSIFSCISSEKNKFRPRAFFTTSAKPGSYTGNLSSGPFQAAILFGLASTTVMFMLGHLRAITAIVGPPT